MIDKNKTYKTRDDREVRIYATDGNGPFPVHGAIETSCGWASYQWMIHGRSDAYMERDEDLIEVRPRHKRTVWLNVYPDKNGDYSQIRAIADAMAGKERIACINVELDFEEGQGL